MYNIDNNILEFSCILSIVYTRIFVYNVYCKDEITSHLKSLESQNLQSPIKPTCPTHDGRKGGGAMYSEYGFVLNGIEYATEAEAREALAEMQA